MDVYIIPPTCKEEHLFDTEIGRKSLENHHIKSAGLSELKAPYSVFRTLAQDHVILFTREGSGILELDHHSYTLRAGSMCVLPAGSTYRYRAKRSWSKTWYHLATTPQWRSVTTGFRLQASHNPEDLTALNRLFLYERSRKKLDSYQVLNLYAQILALLIMRELQDPEISMKSEYWPPLKTLREALYDRPEHDWNVKLMAKKFGFSTRNLQTLIHQTYGCGAMEMVTQVRLEKAAYLLRTTTWKLEEICLRVGYHNCFAFSRVFKRHLGLSPKYYRDKQKAANLARGKNL